jgi:hypothetical protein
VFSGYDAFKQLFPSVTPFGSSRFRESSVFNFLGNVSSQLGIIEYDANLNFVFQAQANVDETLEPFLNWQTEYSPSDDYNGDNFASLLCFNLSDTLVTDGLDVTSCGSQTKTTPRPFNVENIVILYDGYCASTCTIFFRYDEEASGGEE